MNYLEWNNAIAKFYFNEEKSEQDVNLFISRNDIVNIGRNEGLTKKDKKIFKNFIKSVRRGLPGKPLKGNIIEQAHYAFKKWQSNSISINGINIDYPLYIGYLVIFILPLTESHSSNGRSDAYYPKLREFLKKHKLPDIPYQNENCNWNELWEDLEYWSRIIKNTELGCFELHPFKNENWVYVGKPLSQSILPPSAIGLLPKFFEQCGLVPSENISKNYIRQILLGNGKRMLGLSNKVINAIKNEENEIGHSIINLIHKNYLLWTGNTDEYDQEIKNFRKGFTISQLRLCIEGDNIKGYTLYYRLYSELDYPEDLKIKIKDVDHRLLQNGKGWSKPIFLDYRKSFELTDSLNKWIFRFPEKDIRIFIKGNNFHLSGWVEVPQMINSEMLLLVTNKYVNSIQNWGANFESGNFSKIDSFDLPNNLHLFSLRKPPISHPDIPALQYKSEKKIIVRGGLKIDIRTWYSQLLPEIELENGKGDEELYLLFENNGDEVKLKRKNVDHPIWKLPLGILINEAFYIKLKGEEVIGDNLKNYIVDSENRIFNLKEENLPGRDKFGQLINKENSSTFIIGSRLETDEGRKFTLRQAKYDSSFRIKPPKTTNEDCHRKYNKLHDQLANYLTLKVKCDVQDYFEAFETIYQERFSVQEIEKHQIPLSLLKRWSLNYLDYMGFLDFEYSTKKIVVNPPQFIPLPSKHGKQVLLIGGRTPEFQKEVEEKSKVTGLTFNCSSQDVTLEPFLLPPTITIQSNIELSAKDVDEKFKTLANACNIIYYPEKYTQIRLAEFSGKLNEYFDQLDPDTLFDDLGWQAKIFDPVDLIFKPIETNKIDRSFSLIEYKLTEYSFKHRLWIDGKSYNVNKNWGRFIILNNLNQNIFYNDRNKQMVAIPATIPLPRILSEAFVLYSGRGPRRLKMNLNGSNKWYNIYENIPHIEAHNTCLKVGQNIQETTFNI